MRWSLVVILIACFLPPGAEALARTVSDSLDVAADDSDAAQVVLDAVSWEPGAFEVSVEPPLPGEDCHAAVWFASPKPSGDAGVDRARLQWFAVTDGGGEAAEAPAVIVVHSVQPQMVVGKMIARGLRDRGVHAFLLELPGYGQRRPAMWQRSSVVTLTHAPQAVADVRRALDAVAAIPQVEGEGVALVGISLGGYIAATAAGVDGAFDRVFLMLCGGDVYDVLMTGDHDAARVRKAMREAGYDDRRLAALAAEVEPLAVAHRIDAQRCRLIAARDDRVVTLAHADRLAGAIGLPREHYVRINANHYTALLMLPGMVDAVAEVIVGPPEAEEAAGGAPAE